MKKTVFILACLAALMAVSAAQTARTIYYVGIPVYDENGLVKQHVEVKIYALDRDEALSRVGLFVVDERAHEEVRKSLEALGVEEPRTIDYTCVGDKPCGAGY